MSSARPRTSSRSARPADVSAPEPQPGASPARRARRGTRIARTAGVAALLLLAVFAARGWLLPLLPDAALRVLARVVPGDSAAAVTLGERRLRAGATHEALEWFVRAASDRSPSFRLAVDLADAARAAGRYELAAAQAEDLLRSEPGCGRLHRILGECRLALGDPGKGRESLRRATAADPRDAEAWAALAESYVATEGLTAETAAVWREGYRQNAGARTLRYGLAEASVGIGRYEEAEALVRRLPTTMPAGESEGREWLARAWCARGAALRRLRPDAARLAQAGEALERARALDPALPEAPYELGLLRLDLGDLAGAVEALRAATALRPYAHPFWFHLARVERKLGHAEAARHAEGRFALLVSTFGEVNRAGRYLETHPEDRGRRLALAQLLVRREDWESAAIQLERILREEPGHAGARRLMEHLRQQQRAPTARSASGA